MMKIANARIKNVTVEYGAGKGSLAVRLKFEQQNNFVDEMKYNLSEPKTLQILECLMKYTDSYDISELNEKVVRVIKYPLLLGFGHPIEDRFILFDTASNKELKEEEIKIELDNLLKRREE